MKHIHSGEKPASVVDLNERLFASRQVTASSLPPLALALFARGCSGTLQQEIGA